MPVQTPAPDFVLTHRTQLWPDAAVVFLGVSEDVLSLGLHPKYVTLTHAQTRCSTSGWRCDARSSIDIVDDSSTK